MHTDTVHAECVYESVCVCACGPSAHNSSKDLCHDSNHWEMEQLLNFVHNDFGHLDYHFQEA